MAKRVIWALAVLMLCLLCSEDFLKIIILTTGSGEQDAAATQASPATYRGGGIDVGGKQEALPWYSWSWSALSQPLPPSDLLYYVPCQPISPARLVKQVYTWILNWKDNTTVTVETTPFTGDVAMEVALVWWGVVISYGVMMGMLMAVSSCWRRQRRVKKTDLDLRHEQRIHQEETVQKAAIKAVQMILRSPVAKQDEWGCRLQKYWFRDRRAGLELVITLAPISKNCFLDVKRYESDLNDFVRRLGHQYLQPITSIEHISGQGEGEEEEERVAIVQPFWQRGSLRDHIHGENPTDDWALKYLKPRSPPLSPGKVAKYGQQILEAMTYLYKHPFIEVAMDPLGHVHSGNIYIDDQDNCRLGGYENTLLQYRTVLYASLVEINCLPHIDVIMFGHVMYEMCAGAPLLGLFPAEEEYVFEEEYRECRGVLEYIFARKDSGGLAHSIKQIKGRPFFTASKPPGMSVLEQAKLSALGGVASISSGAKFISKQTKERFKKLLPPQPYQPTISLPVLVSKPLSPKGRLPLATQAEASAEEATTISYPRGTETDYDAAMKNQPHQSYSSGVQGPGQRSRSGQGYFPDPSGYGSPLVPSGHGSPLGQRRSGHDHSPGSSGHGSSSGRGSPLIPSGHGSPLVPSGQGLPLGPSGHVSGHVRSHSFSRQSSFHPGPSPSGSGPSPSGSGSSLSGPGPSMPTSLHRSASITSLPSERELQKVSLKKYLGSKLKVVKRIAAKLK